MKIQATHTRAQSTLRFSRAFLSSLFSTSVLLTSVSAFAALGGDRNSVQKDSKALRGQVQMTEHSRYTLHEISHDWVQVHEYESQGSIFGVAWSGKKSPQLSDLLGTHLVDFQTAIAHARKSHPHGGAVSETVGNVHVELGGHMGSSFGQVYLTDQVPSRVTSDEIR